MKKALIFCSLFLTTELATAQNTAVLDRDNGLNFSFNNGDYLFQMGGFIQPTYRYQRVANSDPAHFFSAKRSFLRLAGNAKQEKVSFLIQTNFSDTRPLFDAWVAYHPSEQLTISFGQKQTFVNNREMLFREDRLQFTERSLLSETLSRTGREFGLFVEGRYGNNFGIAPMLAISSGDGRNSFGADSRDTDFGGLKYGGRLDLYPLGYFTEGNDRYSSDLKREKTLKLVVGSAFSVNRGSTDAVGEGHGNFLLYNKNGEVQLPNYRQLYIDLLAKYRGFSLLLEFGNASAAGLTENYTDAAAVQLIAPQQISSLLHLGNSINAQLGYVTPSGYSADLRFSNASPEFASYTNSLLQKTESYSVGLTKYVKEHNLKIQTTFSYLNNAVTGNTQVAELMFQMAF
jgi:hypothetical protein